MLLLLLLLLLLTRVLAMMLGSCRVLISVGASSRSQ
jgi:hypothetical protein